MITIEELQALDHIAKVESLLDGRMFRVTTEEDYFIHFKFWDELTQEEIDAGIEEPELKNVWKWCTFVYPSDNIDDIVIKHISELPTDTELCKEGEVPVELS